MELTKRQQSELITAIKGRGEIPLKFAYIGEGASNWNNVAEHREESGGVNSVEGELLIKKAADFVGVFPEGKTVNVIDIGCGSGYPSVPLLKKLQQRNIPFRYVPIDISSELLDIAEKNILELFPELEIKKFQLDFELGNFSDITYDLKSDGSSNLLLFLGTTLGNHSDRNRVLTNFRDSMTSEDFLIIGVELTNFAKVNKILRYYEEDNAKRFVYFVPEQIGITQEHTTFDVQWNDRDNQVELRTLLKDDISVSIGSDHFVLEKDESLLVARSVKFTEWSITKLLSDVGFRNELLTTNADRSYVLSMVQPTRYSI